MITSQSQQQFEYLSKTAIMASAIAVLPGMISAMGKMVSNVIKDKERIPTENEMEFRSKVLANTNFSLFMCDLAFDRTNNTNVNNYAALVTKAATDVQRFLIGTDYSLLTYSESLIIEKLSTATGSEFDRLFMETELGNKQILCSLAQEHLTCYERSFIPGVRETKYLAVLALFAFSEYLNFCKRIYNEVRV
jgi:hypothetical protein